MSSDPKQPNEGVRILVAMSSDNVRRSFVLALEEYVGRPLDLVCSDSSEAIRLATTVRPDLAIVEAALQPLDGFAVVRDILASTPGVSTLIVSQTAEAAVFRQALRAGARDLIQVPIEKNELFAALDAAIEVSIGKRSALQKIADQAKAHEEKPPAKGVMVFSTKGGTGKTFLATNLAVALAMQSNSVALVDLDLQFGDAAIALGMVPKRTIFDLVNSYKELDLPLIQDFLLTHPSGLQLLPAPLFPDEGEQVTKADVQTVLNTMSGGYDYVIVDTPPFFEDRTLLALEWADTVLLVGSMDIASVKNLKISLQTMAKLNVPRSKLLVVMNRAGSQVGIDVGEVERAIGSAVRYTISSSIEIPKALNAGETLVLTKPRSRVAHEIQQIISDITGRPMNGKRRFMPFGRR